MKYLFLIIISAFFTFSACVPAGNIIVDKLEPAEVSFPDDVEDVLVLNASYYPGVDTMSYNYLRLLEPRERYIIDTIVTKNLFDGFFSVLDESPAEFLNAAPYYEARGASTEDFLEPLAAGTVEFLCDSFNVDAIVSFEYYGMRFDVETDGVTYGDDFYYIATMEMRRYMLWRIYERDLGMISEDFVQDTLYWSGNGGYASEARKNLPDLSQVIREASWFAGYDYARKLSPSWSEVNRNYFQLTGKNGRDISLDPDELKAIANEGGKVRAYKASFNLALYYEMNDDLAEAIRWINRAIYHRPSANIPPYYKKQLEKRLKEVEKLDQQLDNSKD